MFSGLSLAPPRWAKGIGYGQSRNGQAGAVKRGRRRPLNQGRRVRDLVSSDDNHREKKDLTLRQKEIIRMLVDDEMRPTKIAYLLGYSELRAFDRAFRRWTGKTPVAWRTARKG